MRLFKKNIIRIEINAGNQVPYILQVLFLAFKCLQ